MLSWSLKRRVFYIAIILATFSILIGWFVFVISYEPPTYFDGKQNQDELGVDCGGSSPYLCSFQVTNPVILFSRSFEVTPGVYNSVAYVENPNFNIGSQSVNYTFKLLDENNQLIVERKGNTFIAAGRISPIFEGSVVTGEKVPVRTFFEFSEEPKWVRVDTDNKSKFLIKNKVLINEDTNPKISATIENTSVTELKDFEVVSVVFNAFGNAIATSRTFIDSLPKRSSIDVVFTWPTPFTKELEACIVPVDAILLLDTSGSMNDDGDDPPQPLTDAKNAAIDFVLRLTERDRTGLITFATNSSVKQKFTSQHNLTKFAIESIEILPEEETGSTNIGDSIKDAVDELKMQNKAIIEQETKTRKVIILLTDGKANVPVDPGGEVYALEQARIAKENNLSIYTIGLGDKINFDFLKNIASIDKNGGTKQFFSASESKELSLIYSQISESICERGPAIIEIIPRLHDIIE